MPRFQRRSLAAVPLVLTLLGTDLIAAERAPEADRVVRAYLEATGGAAVFAAESTLYTRARLTGFGFTGTLESWSGAPDRRLMRTELGPFLLREGGAAGKGWRTDPTTSRVQALADQELVDSQVSAWFERERWAEPGGGGGTVRHAGTERDSAGTYEVLEVTAPGSGTLKPRRLWFRDQDALLVRTESPRDNGLVITELSQWRRVAGRLRPMRIDTRVAHMPANRLVAVTDSLVVNLSLADIEFGMPGAAASGVRWLRSSGEARVPMDHRARHLWVPVRLSDGSLHTFLFDTGASVTVLDSSFAARLGLRTEGFMQAVGAGASGSASFTTLPSLEVVSPDGDGFAVQDVKAAVLSVSPAFAPYFWREVSGVLGYDVISRFQVSIDYDSAVIVWRDPARGPYRGQVAPLPMVMNGTVPAVHASVDGHEGLFRLDLGSSSTVDLHTPFVARHGLRARLRHPIAASGTGFGGEFASTLGRLGEFRIGPHQWADPMVTCVEAREGAFASEEFAGNIGNRLLERFRVTFDYERRHVFLEPGARVAQRDRFTRLGALMTRVGDRVEARAVLDGSPAARAGLREGDVVVAVDGRAILEWNPESLEARFERSPVGDRVRIAVERDGRSRELRITLREVLP